MRFARSGIHPCQRIAVKIGLLDHSILRGDFAVVSNAGGKRSCPLELLQRHFRIDDGARVHRRIHAPDFYFPVFIHVHLYDGRNIRQEAAMNRQPHAKAIPIFLLAPAGFFRRDFQHSPEPRRIDRILLVVAVVVCVILRQLRPGNDPVGTKQRQHIVPRIFSRGMRKLIGK